MAAAVGNSERGKKARSRQSAPHRAKPLAESWHSESDTQGPQACQDTVSEAIYIPLEGKYHRNDELIIIVL